MNPEIMFILLNSTILNQFITWWGNLYYKLVQVLQCRAASTLLQSGAGNVVQSEGVAAPK